MPTLDLDRRRRVQPRGESVDVVCAPRNAVSEGWCARIAPNPDAPYGFWERPCLKAVASVRDGRPVKVDSDLETGCCEAHSTRTSRKSQSASFRAAPQGRIVVLGAENVVIARLNRTTVDELRAARADADASSELATLEGSVKQVPWAGRVRDAMVRRDRTPRPARPPP